MLTYRKSLTERMWRIHKTIDVGVVSTSPLLRMEPVRMDPQGMENIDPSYNVLHFTSLTFLKPRRKDFIIIRVSTV